MSLRKLRCILTLHDVREKLSNELEYRAFIYGMIHRNDVQYKHTNIDHGDAIF